MTISVITFDTILADARDASPAVDRDSDLRALVLRGEFAVALRCLMRRHGKAIYRYCCQLLRDPALADDVNQQVFIQAFRDLPTFRGRGTLRSWLFRIAHNRAIDAARARRRSPSQAPVGAAAEIADPRLLPDEACDEQRLHAALVAALEELPVRVRSAILMRFHHGMSFEEMAPIFGEKSGTLSARVMREMPRLRVRIEARLAQPRWRTKRRT